MILLGSKIKSELKAGRIEITPLDLRNIKVNSYTFKLNNELIMYDMESNYIDIKKPLNTIKIIIPNDGYILEPGKFYLGSTYEKMGSNHYAKTLHANFSTSAMGMWIQFSAPLGHVGAVINWTLEITVAQKIIIYPYMLIGKLAFWDMMGDTNLYNGKYVGSNNVIASKVIKDY